MAILARHLSTRTIRFRRFFAMNYDEVLERAERQIVVVREMSSNARRMVERAIEMRKRPNRFLVRSGCICNGTPQARIA